MSGRDDALDILRRFRRLLVVGCSATPGKDAHDVPAFMASRGYDVVPVNPFHDEVMGRRSYPSLAEVPEEVKGDAFAVVVFRPSPETPRVAREAVAAGAGAIWLQLGIRHPDARRAADDAGVSYVEDLCVKVEFFRL